MFFILAVRQGIEPLDAPIQTNRRLGRVHGRRDFPLGLNGDEGFARHQAIDLCINNAMVQDKKLERSDCRMQPRSFSREVRTLLIERMTSFINSSTFSGEPLASSRLARDQTPSS